MKIVFVVLATVPLAFSACTSPPAESRKMTEPAMHGAMTGEGHGPGMMGSSPAMAHPGSAGPAMAGGPTMATPGAAMAPAMVDRAEAASTMGAKSKPAMKMVGDKKVRTAGNRL